jgi:hypothetical protein
MYEQLLHDSTYITVWVFKIVGRGDEVVDVGKRRTSG